ncbi:pantothenate kinase family protein-like protein, partial [Genlisea aurea]
AGKELNSSEKIVIKATGGGAFKFANLFMEKLGISLEQVDEVDSLVAGADFALKAWHREAFTYMNGEKEYILLDPQNLYPYLLVNIGTGVSITKVDSENTSQLVSGSSIGGGTFVGLGKLLTKCKSFNELLEQSHQGNTRAIDMLVEDIYGELEYSKLRFPRNALACSFGQAIHQNKELEDYRSEDIALSLLRMISYNIAQLAFMNAVLYGVKRIFFGGSFIHSNEYAMVKISEGIHDWSGGEAKATFLSHEGVLGALGAFL